MENRRFTDTELPVFSGVEGWYQHIHLVQAIVKSNGWPDETAALQLFVHLKGEALDVALLLNKKERESWTGLVRGLVAYYQSPGRLAGLRRQFENASRHPGLDPATFATDLGMLALQGFGDMRQQARDTMIRDKFIAGQEQCALRRQLDGFAQDTPIGEIVDSCHVWESNSDSDRMAGNRVALKAGNRSGDSRTWERNKVSVVVNEREPEMEVRQEFWDLSWLKTAKILWEQCLLAKDQQLSQSLGNKRGFGRGGSASRTSEDQGATDPGGGGGVPTRIKRGCLLGRCREWVKKVTDGERMVRSFQHWVCGIRPVSSPDQPILVIQGGADHGMNTRVRFPGCWAGGCGRQGTNGQFGKGTAMFRHGVFKEP